MSATIIASSKSLEVDGASNRADSSLTPVNLSSGIQPHVTPTASSSALSLNAGSVLKQDGTELRGKEKQASEDEGNTAMAVEGQSMSKATQQKRRSRHVPQIALIDDESSGPQHNGSEDSEICKKNHIMNGEGSKDKSSLPMTNRVSSRPRRRASHKVSYGFLPDVDLEDDRSTVTHSDIKEDDEPDFRGSLMEVDAESDNCGYRDSKPTSADDKNGPESNESDTNMSDIDGSPVREYRKKSTPSELPAKPKANKGIDLSLPPLFKIEDIVEDMLDRAMALGFENVFEGMGGRALNIATMCSGTEAPLLGLRLLSEGTDPCTPHMKLIMDSILRNYYSYGEERNDSNKSKPLVQCRNRCRQAKLYRAKLPTQDSLQGHPRIYPRERKYCYHSIWCRSEDTNLSRHVDCWVCLQGYVKTE